MIIKKKYQGIEGDVVLNYEESITGAFDVTFTVCEKTIKDLKTEKEVRDFFCNGFSDMVLDMIKIRFPEINLEKQGGA